MKANSGDETIVCVETEGEGLNVANFREVSDNLFILIKTRTEKRTRKKARKKAKKGDRKREIETAKKRKRRKN